MDCPDAYREALTRDFSSAPSSALAPSERQAAAAVAESGSALALAEDATVVNAEVIDQR
jgi:hypothetical protein